jgi:hypothetical protein
MSPEIKLSLDDKMLKLNKELETASTHQERKHTDWNESYELYRNKVRTNRLTQRQAVNIPLMKETVKTILSKIDDPPTVDWKEKSSDEFKELIFQEIWNESFKKQKLEWLDVLDKKNVLLYGLSTKFLNPIDEGIQVNVLDVFDVVFDPLMNPMDVETARFVIRRNIFRTLREILADDRYSEDGKNKLKIWGDSPDGIVQSSRNKEEWKQKMERALAMGVNHSDFPTFAGGDVIVNLTEHYTNIWNTEEKKFERHVVVYADKWCELSDELLTDLIGVDEYPFVVWFEDPETNDIYPDGVADLVRTPNKVVNVWYSQLIENRTLQNFQMHWYDATVQNYTPQTYEPGPGRMLPAPGKPNDTIMPVQVNGLDETLTAIDYITQIVERGSGAVAIDKGVAEPGTQTLGEVELLVGKAMERTISMQKFYRGSWYELATKWARMIQANPPKKISLYKTGASGKLYEKKVYPNEWKSVAGYEPIVSSTSEQEANDLKSVQKFMAVTAQFPNNTELRKIAQKRQLELLDFTPDELKRVEEAQEEADALEKRALQQQIQQAQAAQPVQQPTDQQQPQSQPIGQPTDPELEGMLQELATLSS